MQGGKFNRKSVRLKNYDYSRIGMYFITVCAENRECLFGRIENEKMILNEMGRIVEREWLKTSEIRKEIYLDEYVIMPNHFHAIVFINNNGIGISTVGANGRSPLRMRPKSISSLMAGFKSSATSCINKFRHTPLVPIWQRNYYEHIIRNEISLDKIRNYIANNPGGWPNDVENNGNVNTTEKQQKSYYNNLY
ncbi:MAG: transposase [Patescibacteria group bacterium]|nr:transposase [Patescibacteria group bacterium]